MAILNNRSTQAILASLREIPLFSELTDSALKRIDSLMSEITLKPGARLTTEGALGREAFIVISGTAEVLVDGEPVSTVGAGDVVGEMALLNGRPRTATVIAQSPMRLYVLNSAEFSALLSENQISASITSTNEIRLRELDTPS